jgi:hypothetical protein
MPQTLAGILEGFSRSVSIEAAYLASRYRLAVSDVSLDKILNKGIAAQP